MRNGVSPFELLYGVKPLIIRMDSGTDGKTFDTRRMVELLAMDGLRASRTYEKANTVKTHGKVRRYNEGDLVLVAYYAALQNSKWSAMKSRYYGSCRIIFANHPRYDFTSLSGRRTRKSIHARRLLQYFLRK